MTLSDWLQPVVLAIVGAQAVRAWRRRDRPAAIDGALLVVGWLALVLAPWPAVRYGLGGLAMAAVLIRQTRRVFFTPGHGRLERALLGGLLVCILLLLAVLVLRPSRGWALGLFIAGAAAFFAPMVIGFAWISRLLVSALRLRRDLKRGRPPRVADERTLGIDLSVLRNRPPSSGQSS